MNWEIFFLLFLFYMRSNWKQQWILKIYSKTLKEYGCIPPYKISNAEKN